MEERKLYQATEKQETKWAKLAPVAIPTDDEFRTMWGKAHHGKVTGWGMGKQAWIISNLKNSREYQMGLWQGRVDALRNLDYSEERNENTYNLGYYRGYTNWESDRRGLDRAQTATFIAEYGV